MEVRFEDLDRDPESVLERIYGTFGWRYQRGMAADYLETLRDFKKNHHKPLTKEEAVAVGKRWDESFKEFGYELDLSQVHSSLSSSSL